MKTTLTACSCVFAMAGVVSGGFVGGPDNDTTDAITATSSTMENDPRNSPIRTIDGSGLDSTGTEHIAQAYTITPAASWLADVEDKGHKSGASDTNLGWIKYEFNRVYELRELWIWNYNSPLTSRGMKDVTIDYSCDGTNWVNLGNYTIPEASGSDDYSGSVVADFGCALAKAVVITARPSGPNRGGTTNIGLSEVRFHHTPEAGMIGMILLACVVTASERKRRAVRAATDARGDAADALARIFHTK